METQPLNPLGSYDQLKKIEEIKKLIEDNIKETKQLQYSVKKINRYILWSRIFFWTKLILLVLAIVFGYIYLSPPIIKAWQNYSQIIQTISPIKLDSGGLPSQFQQIQDILSNYKKVSQ
jgi:hypothetical protein